MLLHLKKPILLVPAVLGASSISTLLLYFYGFVEMRWSVPALLGPAVLALVAIALWARRTRQVELFDRIMAGAWAGALATFAYDCIRVPIAWSGVPVFKAISYFGTVILDQTHATWGSEAIGWSYHVSNGIGFAIMYTAVVSRPRWWTAVAWGVVLEVVMLLTPYAEVFGYRLSGTFLTITLGSHIVYGIVLWASLSYWLKDRAFGQARQFLPTRLYALCFASLVGVAAIATDFRVRHASRIPPSPPPYIGKHLYTTWNALEPDRLTALWILKRFVDPSARYHFVEPFSHIKHGTPIDTPEAGVRRTGTRSVTEVLVEQNGLGNNEKLKALVRMAHLSEIQPWMRPIDRDAQILERSLRDSLGEPDAHDVGKRVERAFRFLDVWYAKRTEAEAGKRPTNSAI